jgi:hypothetical protein
MTNKSKKHFTYDNKMKTINFLCIVNNLLTFSTKAIDLGISPRIITTTIWNNSENLEDGLSSMKHPEICSYTIPKSPFNDKWGAKARAWTTIVLSRIKVCSGLKSKINGWTRFEGKGCKATMVSFKGLVNVMGKKVLEVRLYSLTLFKVKHQQKWVVE